MADELVIQAEVGTLIPAFNNSVTTVINAVFKAEDRPERFGSWAMPGNIIPDFIVAIRNDATYSQAFLPGEAKVNTFISSGYQSRCIPFGLFLSTKLLASRSLSSFAVNGCFDEGSGHS